MVVVPDGLDVPVFLNAVGAEVQHADLLALIEDHSRGIFSEQSTQVQTSVKK